jgi:hypothetical protein|tara:strand:+ start:450 stop:1493 length:1044 start_codon:yes stop_codon:yes gene_type:complete
MSYKQIGNIGSDSKYNDGKIVGPDNEPSVDDKVTAFTSPGTFSPVKSTGTVLVVAGGGHAGGNVGAGGGAGGLVLTPTSFPFPGSDVTVTIGAGGADGYPNSQPQAPSGSDTTFGPLLTAKGGGGGGTYSQGSPNFGPGADGGSGGGGRGGPSPGSAGAATQPQQPGVSGSSGFGNAGGAGAPMAGDNVDSGGGGGAGGAGNSNKTGGDGKDISPSPAFASGSQPYYPSLPPAAAPDGHDYGPVSTFAGGGGGINNAGSGPINSTGTGGPGGGAPGLTPAPQSPVNYTDGIENRGGGGGGGSLGAGGGSGGSGIVIVQEADAVQGNSSGIWDLTAIYKYRGDGKWLS